jgi:hypothetical protein
MELMYRYSTPCPKMAEGYWSEECLFPLFIGHHGPTKTVKETERKLGGGGGGGEAHMLINRTQEAIGKILGWPFGPVTV